MPFSREQFYRVGILCWMGAVCHCLIGTGGEPRVVESGPHHRIVEEVTAGFDADGQSVWVTNSVVILGSGINRWDEQTQQYVPAEPVFELTTAGDIVAQRTQHKVILSKSLTAEGSLDVLAPDGKRFRSTVLGLALLDAKSGANVMLAEAKSVAPVLVSETEVQYPDAMDGIKASIRYRLASHMLEQDVLLHESLTPEVVTALGINPTQARLLVMTEFHEAGTPSRSRRTLPSIREGKDAMVDQDLDFGGLLMGPGKAFGMGLLGLSERDENVATAKSWDLLENRRFLVESVDYEQLWPMLEKLPEPEQGSVEKLKSRVKRTAGIIPPAKAKRIERQASSPRFEKGKLIIPEPVVAATAAPRKPEWGGRAVVCDFTYLVTAANVTLSGDKTFYVTNAITLSSATIIEAGSVIKLTNGTAKITISGTVTCNASAFRPASFVFCRDDSLGDVVGSGSVSGGCGNPMLEFTQTNSVKLSNVRFVRAQTAISIPGGTGHDIRHAQFVDCGTAIQTTGADVSLRNVLVQNATNVFSGSTSTGRCEYVTVNGGSYVNYGSACSSLYMTNCLVAGTSNTNGITSAPGSVVLSSSAGVFQGVGAGTNYLAALSPYRNYANASTNIDATLAKDLRRMTTYPPILLASDFTSDTVLQPQATRDTLCRDPGYHYAPLDYCLSTLNVTNCTITLTNGVAVGFYGSKGFVLKSGANLVSAGFPNLPNRLVRYTACQEMPWILGTNSSSFIMVDRGSWAGLPNIRLAYTDIAFQAAGTSARQLLSIAAGAGTNALVGCQVRGMYIDLTPNVTNVVLSLINNIFQQSTVALQDSSPYLTLSMFNNLVEQGAWTFRCRGDSALWVVRDNLFDPVTLTQGGGNSLTASNNGYRSGLTSLGGTTNVTGLTMDFVSGVATNWYGVLSGYYIPTTGGNLSQLIDLGSRSRDAAGLYHFTVKAADSTKEGLDASTRVDIGYHFAGASSGGGLLDLDGDGVPDLIEDANGNGIADTGETDWQTSPNGSGIGAGLVVFTPRE